MKKILIVDDDKALCEVYTILFTSHDCKVKTSHDGLRAITDTVDFQPDLILLDIMMPEMNGYEFLETLRRNTSMNPVVIVFSNLTDQKGIDRSLRSGADAYLQKSEFSGQKLVDKVGKIYRETILKRQAQ